MKILLVVQNYTPSVGGTQTFFQHFAENCVANHGDEVTVITTNSYFGPDKKQFKLIKETYAFINGVHVNRFPFFRWHQPVCRLLAKIAFRLYGRVPEWINNYLSGPWSPKMINAITRSNADVILAGTSNYLYMQYPLYRQKLQQPKPFVFQGAIHFKEDTTIQVISRQALAAIAASEYYLANTHYEKNRLAEMGITPDKIVVSGCGVQVQDFTDGNSDNFRQRFAIADDAIIIAYIGRIEATKNIEQLLAAFEIVAIENKDVVLILAGYPNPGYMEVLNTSIQLMQKTTQSKLIIIPSIEEKQKVDLLHAINIFVLPSYNESFGIVFLEAWICKKPVIGIDIGAIKDVVTNGQDGYLVQPNNAGDMALHIQKLISNPQICNQMGEAGYKKVVNSFTWDKVSEICRNALIMAKDKFDV